MHVCGSGRPPLSDHADNVLSPNNHHNDPAMENPKKTSGDPGRAGKFHDNFVNSYPSD